MLGWSRTGASIGLVPKAFINVFEVTTVVGGMCGEGLLSAGARGYVIGSVYSA